MTGSRRGADKVTRHTRAFAAALLSVALMPIGAVAQPAQMPFSDLPRDVVGQLRRKCCHGLSLTPQNLPFIHIRLKTISDSFWAQAVMAENGIIATD